MTFQALLCLLGFSACFPNPDSIRPGASGSAGTTGGAGITGSAGHVGDAGSASGGQTGVDGGADAGGIVLTREQRCTLFGTAVATLDQRCEPTWLAVAETSLAHYAARLALNCNLDAPLPGLRWPPDPIQPCLDALAALPCGTYLHSFDLPAACTAAGLLTDGSSCSSGFQCLGGLCSFATGADCGTCAALPTRSQPCTAAGNCAIGLVCGSSNTCITAGRAGDSCVGDEDCGADLFCGGTTQVPVCTVKRKPGAQCSGDNECDYNGAGSVCNTDLGRCVNVTTSLVACSLAANGDYVFCATGNYCPTDGQCVPFVSDGAPCSTKDGPDCDYPATCEGTTSPVCTLPAIDPSCPSPTAGAVFTPASQDRSERVIGLYAQRILARRTSNHGALP